MEDLAKEPLTRQLWKYLMGTYFRRFLTIAFLAGAGMTADERILGVVLEGIEYYTPLDLSHMQEANTNYTIWIGVGTMALAALGQVIVHVREVRAETREERRQENASLLDLAGRFEAIANAFDEPYAKAPGFQVNEILSARKAAKLLERALAGRLGGDPTFAAFLTSGPMADSSQPLLGVTSDNLRTLAADIREACKTEERI